MVSRASQWPEWQFCVPYLAYLACAVEHKKSLEWYDIKMIGSVFLMVFFGFTMTWTVDRVWSGVALALSCLCIIVFAGLVYYKRQLTPSLSFNSISEEQVALSEYMQEKQSFRSSSLLYDLSIIFFIFPCIYFLGFFNLINADAVNAGYILGSVVGKLVFVSIVIQWHSYVQDEFFMLQHERV